MKQLLLLVSLFAVGCQKSYSWTSADYANLPQLPSQTPTHIWLKLDTTTIIIDTPNISFVYNPNPAWQADNIALSPKGSFQLWGQSNDVKISIAIKSTNFYYQNYPFELNGYITFPIGRDSYIGDITIQSKSLLGINSGGPGVYYLQFDSSLTVRFGTFYGTVYDNHKVNGGFR
jgi:hypothetical protein